MEPNDLNDPEVAVDDETLKRLTKELKTHFHKEFNSTSNKIWEFFCRISLGIIIALGGWVWQIDRSVNTNQYRITTNREDVQAMNHLLVDIQKGQNNILQSIVRLEVKSNSEGGK